MQCQECSTETTGDICPKCGATIEGTPKWYAEGIAYLGEQKQFALAHELLEEGLQAHSTSVLLWYNGGVLEEQMNNREGAVRCYQEVIKLRPSNEKAYQALERLLGRPMPRPAAPAPAAPPPPPPPAAAPLIATAPVSTPAPAPAPASGVAAPMAEVASSPAPHDGAEVAEAEAAVPEIDLTALPPLSPARADVEAKSRQWALIARITGIAFVASFLLLIVFMNMKSAPLFFIALIIYVATTIGFFVARSMVIAPDRRR
jgi:hypothetical protein